MELGRWHCYIVISAIILPLIAAKPFSINEALAAESKLKKSIDTAPSPVSSETNTRFSLNKALAKDPLQKLRKYKRGSLTSKSPLIRSKNIFQIGSSRLKALLSPLRKHKPQSKKREIQKNEVEKYIPLFKNLDLLFDNLLNSESRDSYELSKHKHKRYKFKGDEGYKSKGDEGRGVVCSCAVKSDSNPGETKSHKKTTISTEALTLQKSSPTASATVDSAVPHLGGLRSDKDVPALLSRDPSSSRRDDHGDSEGSGSTFHRNAQRNIAGDFRNRQYHARIREDEADAECDEEDTDGYPRDDADGAESTGRGRGTSNFSSERPASIENKRKKNKKANIFRGHSYELPRKIQFKTRRNETESEELLPKYIRVRGSVSENKIGDIAESLQSEENYKKDFDNLAFPSSDDQRITGGGGEPSTKDQEASPGNEAVISVKDLSNVNLALQRNPKVKSPSVTIIDGYSVARDKNGQNKLSEKTIRFHS